MEMMDHGPDEDVDWPAMPAAAVRLRIVLNPASMAKDVAAVEAAVEEVLRGA